MKLTKDDLIAALRLRYDYYSAQTMLESGLARAGIPLKDTYDATEVAAFRAALATVGDRLTSVEARFDSLMGTSPAEPAKAEPVKAEAAKAETAKTDSAKTDSAKTESAMAEAAKTESAKTESAKTESAKTESAKTESAKTESAKTDSAKADSAKADSAKADSAKADSAKADSAAAEPPTTEPAKTIETIITLTGVPVEKGERVLVCGGLPELGDWDVARARPMVREGDRWLATLEIPAGTEAAFKFVRCAADGSAIWEKGDNRSLVAVPSIETSWQ